MHGVVPHTLVQALCAYLRVQGVDPTPLRPHGLDEFSPDHLARRFKVTTGQSLRQYIIACRLQRARELILTSELPIAEIALGVGFTDHSHLTRSFKERFGVTPQSARGLDPKSRDSTRQGGETTVP